MAGLSHKTIVLATDVRKLAGAVVRLSLSSFASDSSLQVARDCIGSFVLGVSKPMLRRYLERSEEAKLSGELKFWSDFGGVDRKQIFEEVFRAFERDEFPGECSVQHFIYRFDRDYLKLFLN